MNWKIEKSVNWQIRRPCFRSRRKQAGAFLALVAVAVFGLGCESGSETSFWKKDSDIPGSSPDTTNTAAADGSATATNADGTLVAADQVAYGTLRWSFGGISGGGYASEGVALSGLRISGKSLSFSYDTDLSAWGYGKDALGGYACLFVQKSDGGWVGGKFDWISSSRSSRGLENVLGGYEGWSLAGVPNPCAAAFVILDANKKRRSNVITGTWSR